MDELGSDHSRQRAQLPEKRPRRHFVQTERAAHEKWAALGVKHPAASALLHLLAANVGENNAVVASQKVLAKLMGSSTSTVKRALKVLEEGNWIEVAQIGQSGTVNAYVVNSRVAWTEARDQLRYARLKADVLLVSDEQPKGIGGEQEPLHRLPRISELQIPSGDGLPPPSEPRLPGMEVSLPGTPDIDDG
jgi:DNA-binding transcriptional regulator YhcF (GntR family)